METRLAGFNSHWTVVHYWQNGISILFRKSPASINLWRSGLNNSNFTLGFVFVNDIVLWRRIYSSLRQNVFRNRGPNCNCKSRNSNCYTENHVIFFDCKSIYNDTNKNAKIHENSSTTFNFVGFRKR